MWISGCGYMDLEGARRPAGTWSSEWRSGLVPRSGFRKRVRAEEAGAPRDRPWIRGSRLFLGPVRWGDSMPWTMLVVMVRALGVACSIWRCPCVMSHCVSGPHTRGFSLSSSVSPRGIGAYTRSAGPSLVAFCIAWVTFPRPPECCANPLVCALYIP